MAEWHKSSYSGARGDCVEVAEGLVTGIRDTKNLHLGHLEASWMEWKAFVEAVRL
ncbi:DUF397 domain-containing protein [Nocardiopsis sp. NPDC007018]|uniref:DUF397 domain-containing protein n=1 Tax=Nocardiopsis sp. NPDC007018 TaxID=3155721 RepID=UPI00340C9032